jgi:hypothetical protein
MTDDRIYRARLVLWTKDARTRKSELAAHTEFRRTGGLTISRRGDHELVITKRMHADHGTPIDLIAHLTDVVARTWRDVFKGEWPPANRTTVSCQAER